MKKILAALAALVVAVIGVVSAKSQGLITAESVATLWFGIWYTALAVCGSWALTAMAGSRHRAWAMGFAAGLMLLGGAVRWYPELMPVGWLAVTFIVSIVSPLAFMAAEAALLAFGIRLRKGDDGEVIGVKVGDDETVFLGSPTVPDLKREGIKPEPSNE